MPKYPGIHTKTLKSGQIKYYGSAWSRFEQRAINTSLYPTAAEAKEALGKLRKQIQAGVRFDNKYITVKQFIELYLQEYIEPKRLDPVSKKTIRARLHQAIVPLFGDRRLSFLNAVDMQNLQNELLTRYSASTVNRYVYEFSRVIKRAIIWGYRVKDITLGLDAIKVLEEVRNTQARTDTPHYVRCFTTAQEQMYCRSRWLRRSGDL